MTLSVLVSVYAKENPEFLNQAFFSVWDEQSLKPSQIVLVKDGTLSPELEKLVKEWQDKLSDVLTIVELPENIGLGGALNAGLRVCQHDLVARMDADDIAHRERFEKQVQYLELNPQVDVLGSFVQEMSSSGELLDIRRMPTEHEDILTNLWACPLIHPSIMMRRDKILNAGNYSVDLRRRQDYELWFRCAEQGVRFANLDLPLLYYRFGVDTHRRQSAKVAWVQGVIGFKGASRIKLPVKYRYACFFPFFRSLLPLKLQHVVYKLVKPLDPRQKS